MGRSLSMGFLATIVIAALIQSSAAQTTHTVGGTAGWVIPSSATVYPTWAASQTFSVGDVLVFNFANNQHDVTKVTKADYDACTTTNAITKITTSPASITINGTGEHYFICGFTGHCAAGQKLMINVSAATSAPPSQPPSSSTPAPQPSSVPAPQAATPTPVSSPSPAPVSSTPDSAPTPATTPAPSAGVSYTVGDDQGWIVPTNTSFYKSWASNKNFLPGDILVFNYSNGAHDVSEVSKADFDSCNTASPISINRAPPTRITLTAGEHYYICSIPGHCAGGQKLDVSVGATTPGSSPSAPTPSGSTSPPSPDSSARSVGVAGLSATFLSLVVVLLF